MFRGADFGPDEHLGREVCKQEVWDDVGESDTSGVHMDHWRLECLLRGGRVKGCGYQGMGCG